VPQDAPIEIRQVVDMFNQTAMLVQEREASRRALEEARDTAEQASLAKGQFLATMSHELRTPMNAILGLLQLLQATELDALQHSYASKTEGAARALLGLLNDILDFSKIEAGKMTLDPRPFRVDRLLRDLSVILSANVSAKGIDVLFDVDPAVPKALVGDDMRLSQILINLGGNAIKFTSHGEVVVGLHLLERSAHDVLLEFSVRDSGIGIAPENQSHIFSGFSQAEASTTRRFGGTGLGLAICQRLVSLMDGELTLRSALGQGSTFSFRIRLAQNLPEATPALPAHPAASLRALVIDDNEIARTLLASMTTSLGWQTDMAGSGAQAVDMVSKSLSDPSPYQVVFVDWKMPEMDGWEASARIRRLLGSQCLIIMVSARGRDMLAQRSVADQATLNGFLVKPVTASMLHDAVLDAQAARARAQGGRNPVAAKAATDKPKRLLGMRLLVVEDNKINQLVAKGLLGQEGALVTLADNGQLGVEALRVSPDAFDAVLMDVQMPVMDGYQATHTARTELGLTALPIIAMTANAMASDREACLLAGMNDHVGKPFEIDHLVATLRRFVAPKEAPRA
jgi:signal transduction histidine kinase/DNA-binding response OmpR family regulator